MTADPARTARIHAAFVAGDLAALEAAVEDASLLPDAPGVNPQASVMAVALRNARHLAGAIT